MEISEKEKQLVITVSDKINIYERNILQTTVEKVSKNLWAILFLILLNFFSPFLGFCLPIWPTIIISWGINAIGVWVGYRAITKLKEIRISERG
jgi:hypothetical protein